MKFRVKEGSRLGSTEKFLNELENNVPSEKVLKHVADDTIEKLKRASPNADIANSWSYDIEKHKNHTTIYFNNSSMSNNGENLVILIDNGHATIDGNWVSGTHFTKQPLDEAYKQILEETMEELHKL